MEHVLTFMILVAMLILTCSLLVLCILVLLLKDRPRVGTEQGTTRASEEIAQKTEEELEQEKAMKALADGMANLLSYDGTPQKKGGEG